MTTQTPNISVVLPAYNCAAFLPQAIDSILAQTQTDFELLVVYDHSTDNTLEVIEQYVAKDSRVHLVYGEQKRLVGALNLGIAKARGQFIARMDADDISLPTRFALQLALMQEKGFDFCGTQMLIIDEQSRAIQEVPMPITPDLITITLACTVPFAHGSVMMRKGFLQTHQLQYQAGAVAEDYQFWCKAYHLGARFGNIDQFVFQYRYLPQSLSKVHAKVVGQHTSLLRRQYVRDNLQAVQTAIGQLAPWAKQLSNRDATFLILAAYLVFLQTKSLLVFRVARHASLKAIGLALAKIVMRF